jgi:hypothetical protein
MLVHEDLLLVNFTLTRNSQLNLDDRLNPSDYPANSKKVQKQKKHLFLGKCFFVTATGFKPVTG